MPSGHRRRSLLLRHNTQPCQDATNCIGSIFHKLPCYVSILYLTSICCSGKFDLRLIRMLLLESLTPILDQDQQQGVTNLQMIYSMLSAHIIRFSQTQAYVELCKYWHFFLVPFIWQPRQFHFRYQLCTQSHRLRRAMKSVLANE